MSNGNRKPARKYPRTILSTTMCEEKRDLKERLGAIMESKKRGVFALVVPAVLIVALAACAVALGAGSRDDTDTIHDLSNFTVNGLPYPKPFDLSTFVALRTPYAGDNSAQMATIPPSWHGNIGGREMTLEEARRFVNMEGALTIDDLAEFHSINVSSSFDAYIMLYAIKDGEYRFIVNAGKDKVVTNIRLEPIS